MGFADWLRERLGLRPTAPPELRNLMVLRGLYLEQVAVVTSVEAAQAMLERKLSEHRAIAQLWDGRARPPAPNDVIDAARRLADRYWRFVDSETDTLGSLHATLVRSKGVAEWLLEDLIRLGADARSAGIDTRALAVEIDVGKLERTAIERIALSILDDGGIEQDEDRIFLERLFERGLKARTPLECGTLPSRSTS